MIGTRRSLPIIGALLLQSAADAVAFAQAPTLPPPISYWVWQQMRGNPQVLQAPAVVPQQEPSPAPPATTLGSWQAVTSNPGIRLSNPLLMTDGTVIAHNGNAGDWWRLTPDSFGNYATGTWSKFATLPTGYTPLYFGSEVLPDGRVVINGGEYNGSSTIVETNQGAIYYPSFGAWTKVAPPVGWSTIGDASTVVLDDGTYMLANCCAFSPALAALFDATPPFTSANWTATGTGKADGSNSEEGWIVLPNGNVLTVDVYVFAGTCAMNSETYDPTTGAWSSAGSTQVQLPGCNNGPLSNFEIGPMVLRPDGTVVAFGGTDTAAPANTAVYDSSTGVWTAGPTISYGTAPYTLADAPAAVLPSGNILFAASPGNWTAVMGPGSYPSPTHFFEFSTTNTITQTADTPNAPSEPSFDVNFLVLPSGQVLATEALPKAEIYTETGASPNPAWAPVIGTSPTDVTRGHTYQLTGTQFNGLTHGAAYGDDVQGNTNYPLVRIVNDATGHVFYARTFDFNTMSVAPNTSSSTNFTVSGLTETGPSTLFVIANGISSTGVPVTVH